MFAKLFKAMIESESVTSIIYPFLNLLMEAVMLFKAVVISAIVAVVLKASVFVIESLRPLMVVPMLAPPTAAMISPVPPTKHDPIMFWTCVSLMNFWVLPANPVLVTVTSSHSHNKNIAGTMIEKIMAIRKPKIPKKNKKTHEKYIKYLHLYLSQKVIKTTPSNAKIDRPSITP